LEALSDGEHAIAITLLVLDLAVPSVTTRDISGALLDQWPIYLAYVVSFATIGGAWLSHSTITAYLDNVDEVFLRLNLLLLLFVSVLPYPTHLVGEYVHRTTAERIAITVYGLNLVAILALTKGLWRYAVAEHCIKGDTPDEVIGAVTAKIGPSLAFFGVAIGIGLLLPDVAAALYLVIGLYLLIPFRAVRRLVRHRPGVG
jgi:uncharacterized membrane protein